MPSVHRQGADRRRRGAVHRSQDHPTRGSPGSGGAATSSRPERVLRAGDATEGACVATATTWGLGTDLSSEATSRCGARGQTPFIGADAIRKTGRPATNRHPDEAVRSAAAALIPRWRLAEGPGRRWRLGAVLTGAVRVYPARADHIAARAAWCPGGRGARLSHRADGRWWWRRGRRWWWGRRWRRRWRRWWGEWRLDGLHHLAAAALARHRLTEIGAAVAILFAALSEFLAPAAANALFAVEGAALPIPLAGIGLTAAIATGAFYRGAVTPVLRFHGGPAAALLGLGVRRLQHRGTGSRDRQSNDAAQSPAAVDGACEEPGHCIEASVVHMPSQSLRGHAHATQSLPNRSHALLGGTSAAPWMKKCRLDTSKASSHCQWVALTSGCNWGCGRIGTWPPAAQGGARWTCPTARTTC